MNARDRSSLVEAGKGGGKSKNSVHIKSEAPKKTKFEIDFRSGDVIYAGGTLVSLCFW